MTVKRNAPCPCGSGKKYKKCCLHSRKKIQPKAANSEPATSTDSRNTLLCLLAIVVAGIIVYFNSFQGVFLFDDIPQIVKNESIRSLAWPWAFLENTRRPVLLLTLALNYAADGLNPRGYHLFNLIIHILNGILLFSLLRQTFRAPRLKHSFKASASWLALAITLLWLVHPLQTQSVTYIIQRAESVMSLMFLLTVWFAIRYFAVKRFKWLLLAWTACLFGGLTKEVIITAPVVIFLYDRAFISNSFTDALKKHWRLYAGLISVGLFMICLLFTVSSEKIATAGFSHSGITPFKYALTQPAVILHYLKLSFWPHNLLIDYAWPRAESFAAALPTLVVVLTLLLSFVWVYCKKKGVGFLGLAFFLILAPSSSFIPIQDIAFEHRMYLPLACVLTLIVLVVRVYLKRLKFSNQAKKTVVIVLFLVPFVTLGFLTIERNKDYFSEVRMWRDTVKKSPRNCRPYNNLGKQLVQEGKVEKAAQNYATALELCPDFADAHNNYGVLLVGQNNFTEGIKHYTRAVEANPLHAQAYNNLGVAYILNGQSNQAAPYLEKALAIKPDYPKALNALGVVRKSQGKGQEALKLFTRALELAPNYGDAQRNHAEIVEQLNRSPN